ncbi:hypothetical protein D3C81_313220 [compost metagenome]
MQDFFMLLYSAKTRKENISRKMQLIFSVIDRDEQFHELQTSTVFTQLRIGYERTLETISRNATQDLYQIAQRLSAETAVLLEHIDLHITKNKITKVPMLHELMGPLFGIEPEVVVNYPTLPMASGDTLAAKAEMACSFAALGEGNWSEWRFGDHTGLIYATDAYCVFFNASGQAFTGSFSVFADSRWKGKFMALASQMHYAQMDLMPLFECMNQLTITEGSCKLDETVLDRFRTELNDHIKGKQ